MKKYNSSALTTNRAEVLEEAAKNGVIIQEKNTNGKVRREFAFVPKLAYDLYIDMEGLSINEVMDGIR